MLLELSSDQEFFRETTAKFLAATAAVDEVRRLRDDPLGFEPDHWRRGAELGWTSLLVDEVHGGGSISGDGLIDATLIAYELGHAAAPGPFVTTNVVAAALASADAHPDVLAGLIAGDVVASWHGDLSGGAGVEITADGTEVIVTGSLRPVESAGAASHVLVTGHTGSGISQVLVPTDAPGVSVAPLQTVDLTRRFATVRLDGVRLPLAAAVGEIGGAAAQAERQLQLGLVLLNAESVGSMQRAFDMTVEWAFDRYSFGRPLASYQELKHRFADMKTWLEASHAISDAAAAAVQADAPEAAELTSIAKAYIGDHGCELLQDCVQIHGGIGVTFEHDLHLFLRRTTVNRAVLGTPPEHRRRIAGIVLEREKAA